MKMSVQNLAEDDNNYPLVFGDLRNPPKEIFVRGNLDSLNLDKCIAIVGTRKITSYGEKVLDSFIPELVQSGICVVSGFMYGVDTYVHRLVVENKGKTIAVLGNGINHIYPPENDKLYKKIIQNGGVLISEYEPDEKPKPWMYAKRNRLIAALGTMGTIVVEADIKSGSLITANRAIELERPLYAVPGQITSKVSRGTNELIAEGKAKLLSDISQILNTKSEIINNAEILNFDNDTQHNIYELLENDELSVDQIAAKLNKNAQEISTELMTMNFEGVVKEDRGLFSVS